MFLMCGHQYSVNILEIGVFHLDMMIEIARNIPV